MKRLLLMTGMLALVAAGCATHDRYDNRPVGGVGDDTDTIRGVSAGFDRVNTGTETARGGTDLGVASPGDQQQREPVDPRYQPILPPDYTYPGPGPHYRRY